MQQLYILFCSHIGLNLSGWIWSGR